MECEENNLLTQARIVIEAVALCTSEQEGDLAEACIRPRLVMALAEEANLPRIVRAASQATGQLELGNSVHMPDTGTAVDTLFSEIDRARLLGVLRD
ncbi:MAG: hypothetical protein WBW32_02750 [Luteibacter sp.]